MIVLPSAPTARLTEPRYQGLELGSGSGEVTRAMRDLGWSMTSVDCDIIHDADIIRKWEDLDPGEWLDVEFIWWSPDCSVYSTMSFPHGHFKNGIPQTDAAIAAEKSNLAALAFIEAVNPRWLIIENPRALMRTRWWIKEFDRNTVSYCQYGFDRMKPTDLFGRFPSKWMPKLCKNGDPCHTPAPRGSRTGTQGRNRQEIAKVPYALAYEIGEAIRDDWGWIP